MFIRTIRRRGKALASLAIGTAAVLGLGCQDVNITQEKGLVLLAPTSVDFGTVATGLVSSQTASLSNSGGARATISSVTVEGGDDAFTVDAGFSGELAKGESVELTLGFASDVAGDFEAQLVVTSDAENPQEKYRLFASSRDPQVFVYPGYVDFGVTEEGNSETATVSLENDALVHVTIDAVTLSPEGAPFDVDLGDLGGGAPALLGPGVTADLLVTFAPTDGAAAGAFLALDTSDPAQPQIVVPLYGNDCEATFHPDFDADGDGVVSCAGDCDDSDATVGPGAEEDCDGVDQDCDGEVDEGTECTDDDGDGVPEIYGDCNDADAHVSPDQPELPDGVDNNCNGLVDENPMAEDDDGDGYAEIGGDCDDTDPTVYPGAVEICDFIDNDCDVVTDVDEGTECYDDDGDGTTEQQGDCNDSNPGIFLGAPDQGGGVDWDCDGVVNGVDGDGDGYTVDGGDCDDMVAMVHPGAAEILDGLDNDCDGFIDEGTDYADDDGDGFTEVDGDCNDGDPDAFPGNVDPEDGVDNNCNGFVDEGGDNFDDDWDGYTEYGGDCDDYDGTVNPGAPDLTVDGVDDDCDGTDGS